jgi:hypothetical protein
VSVIQKHQSTKLATDQPSGLLASAPRLPPDLTQMFLTGFESTASGGFAVSAGSHVTLELIGYKFYR